MPYDAEGAVFTWFRNGELIEGVTGPVFSENVYTNNEYDNIYQYTAVVTLPASGCVSAISADAGVVEHPNSDHLHITTVDLGTPDSPVQIVCGAPNVAAGQKVIVATIGTVLYSGDESFTIKKGKIRGEESLGMICAEDEIGVLLTVRTLSPITA